MSENNRRKALQGLAFTVPVAWTAPLVQSVLLPVHAQTSPSEDDDSDGGGNGGNGGEADPLCCASVFIDIFAPETFGSLVLFNGLVQGGVGACYPTCDGANIQLVQGSITLDIRSVFCSSSITAACGLEVSCAVGGSGADNSPGGPSGLFPGSEGVGLELGPATIRVLTSQGTCGEFDITLVPFEP